MAKCNRQISGDVKIWKVKHNIVSSIFVNHNPTNTPPNKQSYNQPTIPFKNVIIF